MTLTPKLLRRLLIVLAATIVLSLTAVTAAYFYIAPQLPSVEVLRDVRFQVPLQVYTNSGQLVAEYGTKKRDPLKYEQIPDKMIKAFLAAEDDRFFEHPGVDYQGLLRAAGLLMVTGEKSQGGSTITMQVARNFFLSSEKTFLRKFSEILLSLKIEDELTKEQILELYLNQIFLGNRAYGVGSAAQVYYGKPLDQLSTAQIAMIAGLPKAPSRFNPVANPERAQLRRDYVINRMLKLGFITEAEHDKAIAEPVNAKLYQAAIDLQAPYIGEMVRDHMYAKYGENAYTDGYKIFVTIDAQLQQAAQESLRQALLDYDRRHGYRGPVSHIDFNAETPVAEILPQLDTITEVGNLKAALVHKIKEQSVTALLANGEQIQIPWEGLSWAGNPTTKSASAIVKTGDVIYVHETTPKQWALAQIPLPGGAIVSINPHDGAILALTGGFDFFHTKFNRAIQAKRQPGSSFKPFIYAAALEKGFTTASILNDAPVVFEDSGLESSWRPENYSGEIYGPTRLREALVNSRNLVSIRLLQAIGVDYAIDYAAKFGFNPARMPRDLSLSLGTASVTPMELATGYTVFANGGFRVTPYFIQKIVDGDGKTLFEAHPTVACLECEAAGETGTHLAPRIIPQQTTYLATSMMQDVIRRGTARRALQLGRNDLAGKTGTTNDQRDAWFAGFNGHMVTISWMGLDDAKWLGSDETGAKAALPMWVEYMRVALQGKPEAPPMQPGGIVTVKIDPRTGLVANANQKDAIFEIFRSDNAPENRAADIDESVAPSSDDGEKAAPQLLF
jgi:penicillin-binding protein 1A